MDKSVLVSYIFQQSSGIKYKTRLVKVTEDFTNEDLLKEIPDAADKINITGIYDIEKFK